MSYVRTVKTTTNSHKRASEYIGVSWRSDIQKWTASVTANNIKYECGYYDNEREAAIGRDKKIIALNFKKPLQVLKPISK